MVLYSDVVKEVDGGVLAPGFSSENSPMSLSNLLCHHIPGIIPKHPNSAFKKPWTDQIDYLSSLFFCLPPHVTYEPQPLDVSLFGLLMQH